jgi:hypothetical protein
MDQINRASFVLRLRFAVTPMVTYQEAIAGDFDDFWVGILTVHGEF